MNFDIIESIIIYTSLLIMICGITIAAVGIIKNLVYMKRYDKVLVKIKVTKVDLKLFLVGLFFFVCFIY